MAVVNWVDSEKNVYSFQLKKNVFTCTIILYQKVDGGSCLLLLCVIYGHGIGFTFVSVDQKPRQLSWISNHSKVTTLLQNPQKTISIKSIEFICSSFEKGRNCPCQAEYMTPFLNFELMNRYTLLQNRSRNISEKISDLI